MHKAITFDAGGCGRRKPCTRDGAAGPGQLQPVAR